MILPLAAQEYPVETETIMETEIQDTEDDQNIPPENDQLYVIIDFEFDIKGRTLPFALIYTGNFKTGEIIKGKDNLDRYISEKNRILVNQRILKDNAEVLYSIGEQMEDGAYPVTITIKVEDSWNLIALPRLQYSNHSGLDLTIKARDYNFLGTMNPLRVDIGYRYDENNHSSYQFEVYTDTPFRAAGYIWNLRFDNLFRYRPNEKQPIFYQNATGLSIELPFHTTTFTLGFTEYFYYNEENPSRYQDFYGEDFPVFQDGLYMSSNMYASWKIPTGLFIAQYGELTYNPGISATFNHQLPDWPLLFIRKGPFLDLSHSLGFEKVDWHANFRDGLSVFFKNSYNIDFYRLSKNSEPLSVSLTLNGSGFFIISDFFGISSRLQYRHWFYHDPDYYEAAGDNLRGIADTLIHADHMLSLNIDLPLRVLLFKPSIWFKNQKLNFFDLEFQIAPVFDLALYHDPESGKSFHPKNIAASGGMELIVFSDFMRNLYIRLGYAVDLREFAATGKLPKSSDHREIYVIMGHFY
jgi:hypothetical protein